MPHQRLAGHDPRTFFAANDHFASKGALALGVLMGDDFFVIVPLAGALSFANCHGSVSLHKAA
jgi:hypothetical protein